MHRRLLLLSAVVFALVSCGVGTKCFASTIEEADGHRAEKEYSQAEAIYKAIVQDYPGTDKAFTAQRKLIILYMAWDKQAEAEAAYEQLVSEFGGREDLAGVLVGEIAGAFREAEKYESAKTVYEYVVSRWPTDKLALDSQTGIVKCYLGLRDDANSAAALAELFTRFGGHEKMRSVVHDLAFEYRSMRKWAESRDLFRYFVEHWPDDEGAMKAQRLVVKASIRLGDDPNADAAIEELIKLFRDKPGIRHEMSEIANDWAESGRYEKAVPQYKYVVEHWPEDEQAAWTQMALTATTAAAGDEAGVTAALDKLGAESGKKDAAIGKLVEPFGRFCRHLLEIVDEQPEAVGAVISGKLLVDFADKDAASVLDHIGDFYRDTQQCDKAAELFEYVADNWRDSSRAIESQSNIVKMYISIGDEPNATAHFDNLISKFGEDEGIAAAVENVAQEYLEFGSTQKAYEKFKYILEHWPGSGRAVWAKTGMVMSRVRAMDFEEAEAELWELLDKYSMDKELPAGMHEIVEEYRNVGAYDTGRELFGWLLENCQQGDKTMLELQVGVALQSIKLRELDKADAAVAKLIADYNDNANLGKGLFQIAEEHFYANNYLKTIELLELIESDYAESEFPAKSDLAYVLATCYGRVDEFDKAIAYYKKTIEEYPYSNSRYASWAAYDMGWIYAHIKKDYGRAIEWFRRQLELYPDDEYNPGTLFHMGVVYVHELEDYESGAEIFKQYVEKYPHRVDYGASLSNLALCHEKLGNKEEAIRVLREAYDIAATEGLRRSIVKRISRLEEGGTK